MSKIKENIVVFEHEILRFDRGEKKITKDQFEALERYYGNGKPFYKLVYNGVQFNEHVGVIQVGNTLIEVLPKADKTPHSVAEDKKWRDLLIGMLRAVGSFDIKSTSSSNLKIKPNTILDLYFELFIKEVEYLLHNGLVKKYRKKEGNVTALKGSLQFSKHIQQNLFHQERFYVRHSIYDIEHTLHFILYKTIKLLKQINTNNDLHSRIGVLLLHFPEMPDIKIPDATFEKLIYNRKNQHYQKAIEIAKLLLLKYHPDVSKGRNHVLALMFDMNMLWEQFIYVSLKKNKNDYIKIKAQTSKFFWKPENGRRTAMKPDIFIETNNGNIVLDTKWKNLNGYNPSPDDLRQMYVYHEYFDATKVALVYPGNNKDSKAGIYLKKDGNHDDKICSVVLINVENKIKEWQIKIREVIKQFVDKV
ncbi:5-methylcytosine-specific restriction enzyme subunit McrC [Flavobacterium sp. 90]|uniref:McrC family protein n=1 Tax=unclassified Flavobacterium TaxID=196869 RepID=UPI000EB298D9|nr:MULTISPECIES: restriction endonuclease [unclassified Flavobacterium]RKR11563.1 5-methylcytosine-specific restriction enzyme subunit McrC [Flavobacterium sp. 81]TCK55344.1 5-methylcytosine-specific restriction enzyme subunit McrC [Flavobacterium sp. 90]